MFVHLNIHSVYSAMKGLIPLSEIINQAKEYSMNTLALTDIMGYGVSFALFSTVKIQESSQ